ncbi:MAG: S1/P1 nuclease [Burkholderiales bacterium]
MHLHTLWFAFMVVFVGVFSVEAKAWGFEAHELIARQAQSLLSDQARKMLSSLLAQEEAASLESISTWADKHREFPSSTWHYVNFPKGECKYVQARDCPDGNCVIEALPLQLKLFKTSNDPKEQLKAFKFIVHLLSDVHQPLHAAWGEDRGGNRFQLQAFGRGSNLHAFWDSILIRQAAGGIEAVERDVQQQLNKHAGEKPGEVEQWALESCRIVLQEGFYPSGRDVDQAYVQQHRATVVKRLALASRRLADTINQLAASR